MGCTGSKGERGKAELVQQGSPLSGNKISKKGNVERADDGKGIRGKMDSKRSSKRLSAIGTLGTPSGDGTLRLSVQLKQDPPLALFVYGTLMSGVVMKELINRIPESQHATLKGYHRYGVKGAVFPALLPRKGSSTEGLLYLDLTWEELDIIHDQHGVLYIREVVQVDVVADDTTPNTRSSRKSRRKKTEKVDAFVYVWKEEESSLNETWYQESRYVTP